MAILMLSTDLMFASRVSGAAARLGTTLQTAATPETLFEQLAASEPAALVLIDLTTRGFDPRQWVPLLRQAANSPSAILAYGPHVQGRLLSAATAAGCDEVFTRGQFNARMDEILSRR
jgi:DNA-binding NarL/FixJ family response regulator